MFLNIWTFTFYCFRLRNVTNIKKIWTICTKAIDQNIQDTIQVFQIWHNLCSEHTSTGMWTFRIYSRSKKTTNEPTASNNKSGRLQVNNWDTWKTLKYLNISDSFHLKDLEISKYKRESKARMPIQFCCLFFANCGLFNFLNIRKVNW